MRNDFSVTLTSKNSGILHLDPFAIVGVVDRPEGQRGSAVLLTGCDDEIGVLESGSEIMEKIYRARESA